MSFVAGMKTVDSMVKKRRGYKKAISLKSELRELWYNCGLKVKAEGGHLMFPVVIDRQEKDYGEDWYIHLPVGLSEMDVRRKAHKIAAALGGAVQVERVNNLLLMRIMNGEIKQRYDYKLVDRAGMGIPVPIGYGRNGLVLLDLAKAPHLLVGGTPGFGKSAFLHQAVATILQHGIEVYVVDLKRLEFAYLKNHTWVVTTEPDAVKLLQGLCKEMEQRINLLENQGLIKIQDYTGEDLPYIAVIIDELAELQADTFFVALNRLLRLCRAVGISVIAATQRPSVKVLDGDSRAMFAARLCYQVADELNSRMVLGEAYSEAAYLPAVPGRGVYRFGNTVQEVQTMYLSLTRVRKLLASIGPVHPQILKPSHSLEIITLTLT